MKVPFGVAEEGGRGFRQGFATVGDEGAAELRMIAFERGVGFWRVRDDGCCAGGYGAGEVAVAICGAAPHGDKNRAWTDAAGVIFNAGDACVRARSGLQYRNAVAQLTPLHIVTDCTTVGAAISFYKSATTGKRTPTLIANSGR